MLIRHIKEAYFILGPESSGNRMMAKAIQTPNDFKMGGTIGELSSYVWITKWAKGDSRVTQNIINNISSAPNKLILVRSIPRKSYPNKEWLDIYSVCEEFKKNDYKIYPIVMYRKKEFLIKSQVRRRHVPTEKIASEFIDKAYKHIKSHLKASKIVPIEVSYEEFVNNKSYRDNFFTNIYLKPTTLNLFNANKRYKMGGKYVR